MFTCVNMLGLPNSLLIAAQAAAATTGIVAYVIYHRISPALKLRIVDVDTIPLSFRNSETVTHLVNPRNHVCMTDTLSAMVELPPQYQDISDEALLAQFISGYLGGYVLFPERTFFRTFRPAFTRFSMIDYNAVPQPIWYVSQLSRSELPQLHTVVFGGFQVGSIQMRQPHDGDAPGFNTESNIDFIYGKNTGEFAGAHRFSIIRPEKVRSGEMSKVCVRYASVSCNPMVNRPVKPEVLYTFHRTYGALLFREGVSQVMRCLKGVL
ncbi:hypothetical protein GGR54DRAFT_306737 [Hypoxylon sp. NC1633]|nr:hypothetical protein GGR54DRAFT_306737 [Hypoxylon sp. NC1633]